MTPRLEIVPVVMVWVGGKMEEFMTEERISEAASKNIGKGKREVI